MLFSLFTVNILRKHIFSYKFYFESFTNKLSKKAKAVYILNFQTSTDFVLFNQSCPLNVPLRSSITAVLMVCFMP